MWSVSEADDSHCISRIHFSTSPPIYTLCLVYHSRRALLGIPTIYSLCLVYHLHRTHTHTHTHPHHTTSERHRSRARLQHKLKHTQRDDQLDVACLQIIKWCFRLSPPPPPLSQINEKGSIGTLPFLPSSPSSFFPLRPTERLREGVDGGLLENVLDIAGDPAVVGQGQVTEIGSEEIELLVGKGVGRLEDVPEGGGGGTEEVSKLMCSVGTGEKVDGRGEEKTYHWTVDPTLIWQGGVVREPV